MSDQNANQGGPDENAATSMPDDTEQPTREDADDMLDDDADADSDHAGAGVGAASPDRGDPAMSGGAGSDGLEVADAHDGGEVGAPIGVASEGRSRENETHDEGLGAQGQNHETLGAQGENQETLGARGGDADDPASKDPADWVTGDEPMTAAQQSYLDTLAREAGEELPADLTKAQASIEIDRLQSETGRTS